MSLTSLTGYNQWQCNKLPIGCEQAFGLSYFWVPFGKTRTCTCVLVWVLVYYVLKPFPLVIVALCFPHGDFKDEFVHGYCSPAGVAVFCGRHLSARFPWSLSVCPLIIFDSVFQPLCLRLSQYLALPVCLYPSPLSALYQGMFLSLFPFVPLALPATPSLFLVVQFLMGQIKS